MAVVIALALAAAAVAPLALSAGEKDAAGQAVNTSFAPAAEPSAVPLDNPGGPAAERICPNCGAKVPADAKFCTACGAKLAPVAPAAPAMVRPTACPKCGAAIPAEAKFCTGCGWKVELVPVGSTPPTAAPAMEKYQSKDGRLMLFKPKDWKVQDGEIFGPGSFAASVTEPNDNAIMLFITAQMKDGIKDSSQMAVEILAGMQKPYPDIKVTEMKSTPDKGRTQAMISMTVEGKKALGHAYFFYSPRLSSVYILLAREDLWEKLAPTLTAISANLAFAPEGVEKVLKQAQEQAGKTEYADGGKVSPAEILRRTENKEGKQLPLEAAVAADGSFGMKIPKGWALDGGGLCFILTSDNGAKEYGCGYTHHTFSTVDYGQPIPGVVTSPYRPPTQALMLVLSLGKVAKNVQILGESFDNELPAETVKAFKAIDVTGSRTDVRLVHVKFTNATTGRAERGLFTVSSTANSMGISWDCTVCGGWAPANELEDCLPLYAKLGKSVEVNQQWVAGTNAAQQVKSQQLFNNLQDSIKGQQKSFEGYMGSLKDASRSRDYTSWAYSQTTLGQGSWVAENEGAKVYNTDSWGIEGPEGRVNAPAYNNTNFTGRTPWGNDTNLVNTRKMWETYIATPRN